MSAPGVRSQADDVPLDDGLEIDVMVVYTPLAKRREGGRAAIEALIDLFVAETNQAYANSGVAHRIRLVLREEVDYAEDGNSFIDLDRLRNDSDGYMDHVHELRDLYAADIVHIVVGRSVNVCGVASTNRGESPAEDEASGFGLTVDYCGGLVFAHELGHNMGLDHDRYRSGVPAEGSHYGYVNQRVFEADAPESARWHTIMAYPDQCGEVGDFYCEQNCLLLQPGGDLRRRSNGSSGRPPVHRGGRPCRCRKNAQREAGNHRELSPEFGLAHTKSASYAVAVLAGRGCGSHHSDGDAAQAIERGHHSNGDSLAGRRRHSEREQDADYSGGPDCERRHRDDHRGGQRQSGRAT